MANMDCYDKFLEMYKYNEFPAYVQGRPYNMPSVRHLINDEDAYRIEQEANYPEPRLHNNYGSPPIDSEVRQTYRGILQRTIKEVKKSNSHFYRNRQYKKRKRTHREMVDDDENGDKKNNSPPPKKPMSPYERRLNKNKNKNNGSGSDGSDEDKNDSSKPNSTRNEKDLICLLGGANKNRRINNDNDDSDDSDTPTEYANDDGNSSENGKVTEPLLKIEKEINSIDDLIELGEMYDPDSKIRYELDLSMLHRLVKPLKKLKNMIGMNNVKEDIVDFIIYSLQHHKDKKKHLLHTVITGNPGTGKTDLGRILSELYASMGYIKGGRFYKARRSDLVAGYLGQTAIKTQKFIDKCKGGVMFIDEAYSLGNEEGRDSFSKECIDTLNQNLTENRNNFVCIVAGYKDALDKCFFETNEGLERRFPYHYHIEDYEPSELKEIFIKQVYDINWDFEDIETINTEFFIKNKDYFRFNGGDTDLLLEQAKKAHSRRVFYNPENNKLQMVDLENGLKRLLKNPKFKNRTGKKTDAPPEHLYL